MSAFDRQWPARHGGFADCPSFGEPPAPSDDALPVLHAAASRGALGRPGNGAESALTPGRPAGHLPAETFARSTITQIYEGTNQIQRIVMARQLLA